MERLIKNGKRKNVRRKTLDVRGCKKKEVVDVSHLTSHVSRQSGFTLIELMIVMTLIGILAAIAQPQFHQYTVRGREAVLKENLFTLRDVIDQFSADKGKFPDTLQELVDNKYIRKVPEDPFTKSAETWVTVPPDTGEGGIFDVHSGSDLIALNGTPYNEW